MNIKIDKDYSIKSDARNVILVENKISEKGESKGETYENNMGYYSTVQGALKDYLRIKTNLSEATTIKELLSDIARIEKTIEEVLRRKLWLRD